MDSRTLGRAAFVVVAIILCLWLIKTTAALGVDRILVKYALVTRDAGAAQQASQLTPNDAHAHNAAATLASLEGKTAESIASLERAVSLRPRDYTLWMALGLKRDEMGDTAGALRAFDESVRLAPFYAQPKWQRGNVLLRAGQVDEAFADLNQAVSSNSELGPRLVDLAWSISLRDPARAEKLVQMRTPDMRLEFARVLLREKFVVDAVRQFEITGHKNADVNREMIEGLLSQGAYSEALEVWQATQPAQNFMPIHDGGFETAISFNEKTFGWRIPGELKGARVRLDATANQSGAKSLLIEFNGEPAPAAFLSQLVVVEPATRYRLSFAVRADNIVSGGPPIVTVQDVCNQVRLGQSESLQKPSGSWRVVNLEFKTAASCQAILITLDREACTSGPCPIFGSLSLDSFSLEKVK